MSEYRDSPLVTVAILSFEQEATIYECIQSVFDQDYANIELLICDDGSTVFDKAKIERFIEEHKGKNIVSHTVLHQEANVGTVQNCNRAIAHANGEFLKLLAADDQLHDGQVISDLCAQFSNAGVQVVAGRGIVEKDRQGKAETLPTDMEFARIRVADPAQMYVLLCSRPWSAILAPAAMFRLSLLRQLGGFDPTYRYLEDWPFWIKLSKQGVPICFVSRIVVKYSLSGISSTSEMSERNYLVRKQYLRECKAVLETEYLACKRGGRRVLALQCLLSERCIARRERRLARQNGKRDDAPPWSPWDLLALPYQKVAGGIGNQRRFPLWLLAAAGGALCMCVGAGWFFPAVILALALLGGVCWNLFLRLLKRKFITEK